VCDTLEGRFYNPNINIAVIISSLRKSAGGPTRTAINLHTSLLSKGVTPRFLVPRAHANSLDLHVRNTNYIRYSFVKSYTLRKLRLSYEPAFTKTLKHICTCDAIHLIHNHGLWLPSNHSAARVAGDLGLPLVINVHGMLTKWAMKHKAWKKYLAWILYQKHDLLSARVLLVNSEREIADLRDLGLNNPIGILPWGVDLPELPKESCPRSQKKVLFLGRIYPVKGLSNLVVAWSRLKPKGWRLIIAGPDEGSHRSHLEQIVREKGLTDSVSFIGPVKEEDKWELYRSSDLLVLPSFTENFGLVVVEALASGIPVITTKGTPWSDLVTYGCGWWIDIGTEPLVQALNEALSLGSSQLREMGLRARNLAGERYNWSSIAGQMRSIYDWILFGGPVPGSVTLV
jgi:glycosyltransferase involved in cell wall biosynthesis